MLVLDIGGTFIKHALTDEAGVILPGTVEQTPTDAEGSCEAFWGVLSSIIRTAQQQQSFQKACVCIAGPFDFDRGVSMMQHKFRAVYQRSLRPPFQQAGVEVDFLHDSTAFILGEASDGAFARSSAPCCVMLGTGLGFAFMRDGKVCVNEKRTPALTLWNLPWRDGIAEDYVSTRAIQALYGQAVPVRAIADAARRGDERALQAFRTTGRHLSEILREVVRKLGCDTLVLGGQISKSADLFELNAPVPWSVSRHMDESALRGVSYYALHGKAACEQVPVRLFAEADGVCL